MEGDSIQKQRLSGVALALRKKSGGRPTSKAEGEWRETLQKQRLSEGSLTSHAKIEKRETHFKCKDWVEQSSLQMQRF